MARTEVLVVGGGSTGTGIARDLSLRGVDVTLVERGTLTDGTSGRMHGLLHSGARYAVSDAATARHCIREQRVLREVAPHCVEPSGGLFVIRPEDSDEYFDRKLEACRECSIPATVLSGEEARETEDSLARDVERAIRVPDAVVDPFRLCVTNAADADDHGARVETHAEVTDLVVESGEVVAARVRHDPGPRKRADLTPGTVERIDADHVVNAAGAWAGQVASLAGVPLDMRPSRGAMVVTDVREVDTVVNRCRPRSEGDIIVPHATGAVLGTTDERVDDPDEFPREQWEVDLLFDELSTIVPVLGDASTVRTYWGVRPLYDPGGTDGADVAGEDRGFTVLDHATLDGIGGLTSVVGGKLTTYRLMAEQVSDHVCDVLGERESCRTAERSLPGSEDVSVLEQRMDEFGLRSTVVGR